MNVRACAGSRQQCACVESQGRFRLAGVVGRRLFRGTGKTTRFRLIWLLTFFLATATFRSVNAQEAADFFRLNCTSCHTIGGGRLVGPDLKNVTEQKDRAWLINFIVNPQAVIDSGDAYAAKLKKEANGQVMPKVPGITRERAEALLMLIDSESKKERSDFIGVQISMEPFTEQDIKLGREYFLGARALTKGGPPCFSCHAVRGVGALGGGRLGPDLTLVFSRLEGRKNLATYLANPPMTMQPVFSQRSLDPKEVQARVALLEQSAREGGQEGMSGPFGFLILGLGGAIAGLVLIDAIWKNRLRAVRRMLLVRGPRSQGE